MEQSPNTNWIGDKLGTSPYRLVRQLGSGGLADVYLADDLQHNRKVVVKILLPSVGQQNAGFIARFADELGVLRRLEHPHLVRVLDCGEADGRPFLVVTYCPAGNLKMRMLTGPNGQLAAKPPDELVHWLPGVAQALDFLHAQSIVHRDAKPANILFDEQGKACLSEPGLTRACFNPLKPHLTRLDGQLFGTPRYMAPELLERKQVDGRADQFALAMIAWEWLTGRTLFKEESAASVTAIQKMVLSFLPPWVPSSWRDVLRRGLARKPEDRYTRCEDFAHELLARVQDGGAALVGDSENFDLRLPEEEPPPPPPPTFVPPTPPAPPSNLPPPPRTTLVETLSRPGGTKVDWGQRAGADADLRRVVADAKKAHDEIAAWFLVINTTNFPLTLETSFKNWEGVWSAWASHQAPPNEALPVCCRGAIRVNLRYNFRLSGGKEHELVAICPQIWPAEEVPENDQIDCRYRLVIRDGRLVLDFSHRRVEI
ncbi:MAG: serine/threonine-protein kinase [Gemmataceae bacterium]